MICFPTAKINLGLNIVERRPDGYHNLETVFYPVPITDVLEANEMHPDFPSDHSCDIKISNLSIEGDEQQNLIVKAYNLLQKEFPALPRLHVHLWKGIPTQAGMGGGSSDCGFMLKLLNEQFALGLSEQQLIDRAAQLGADCPFFIINRPSYAEGIGEKLQPVEINLGGWHIAVVRPNIPVSTREAFSLISPHRPQQNCLEVVKLPVEKWRDRLVNDFEHSVFTLHPEIGQIKEKLYELGATYAAMSGSGSAVFGLFSKETDISKAFPGAYTFCGQLPRLIV